MALRNPDDVPSRPSEIKARLQADKLEAALYRENRRSYSEALSRHAQAVGGKAVLPRDITSPGVLAGLKTRARQSARSIVATQQSRRAALIEQTGSKASARPMMKQFVAAQGERVAAYEAGMTAHQASDDFVAKNGLTGTEILQPREAAALDECQDAIDAGEVPIGELGSFPSHVNCPHYAIRSLEQSSIPDLENLWTGQDLGDVDAG